VDGYEDIAEDGLRGLPGHGQLKHNSISNRETGPTSPVLVCAINWQGSTRNLPNGRFTESFWMDRTGLLALGF
jgi:hypothetical protein